MDGYEYATTKDHLEPFINPFLDKPFFEEMEETYEELWQFKEHISTWSFGVNRWKDFVYLRYRVQGRDTYLPWNMNEKVTIIEEHHKDYVVIVLREVDDQGKPGAHNHSIVIDVDAYHGKFDLNNLMTFLEGSLMQSLNDEFDKAGYLPWKNGFGKSTANRLRHIWQALDHYAVRNVEKTPIVGGSSQTHKPADMTKRPNSVAAGASTQEKRPAKTWSEPQKSASRGVAIGETSRKRHKSTHPSSSTAGGSSTSGLTIVEASKLQKDAPMEEHEKFELIQKNFWAEHDSCFLFEKDPKSVSITQCEVARDEFIIRTLQRDIIDTVKKELVQIIDVKQRQKVCLTPIDENKNLLKKKPQTWDEIKDGNFMIINGQHSIMASKELQEAGCGDGRKLKLQTWDAYIVWTRDATKLTNISKFYNCTNHLDHTQPTWGNQIISCRNIWISFKRPTDDVNEAATRNNESVYNLTNYQKFVGLIVKRFQNINPVTDGVSIRGPSDLKNEVQIITLPDDIFAYWERFLTMHADGELIDPYTLEQYKKSKTFNRAKTALKREFFRHFGHFTDHDFKVFVVHLLGETPNRKVSYPKVSVGCSRMLIVDNMTSTDWVERHKRKKIILQNIMDIKPSLSFFDDGGDVDQDAWSDWKLRHRFTSGTWDFLMSHPKGDYFKRRLQNEAWTKRAKDLSEKFPEVLHIFTHFVKQKYHLSLPSGGVQVCGIDVAASAFVTSTQYRYHNRKVNLAVLDTRQIPRSKPTETKAAIDPFLDFLANKLEPKMNVPNVWLFILSGREDIRAVKKFAGLKMKEFDFVPSTYVPSKSERLNNVTNRSAATIADVPLLFFFKKENVFASSVREFVKNYYEVPRELPKEKQYYFDFRWNTEAKWRVDATELRMEFYFDILRDFARTGENVLRIYCGSKFLLASKMFGAYYYGFVDRENDKGYRKIATLADKMDMNDYLFANSPYSIDYIRPPSQSPVVVNSTSPASTAMTLKSPPHPNKQGDAQEESERQQPSADLGIDGIDEYGTNTFQIHCWMAAPAVHANLVPTDSTGNVAPAIIPPVSLSTNTDKEEETDDEWEKSQQQHGSSQIEEDVLEPHPLEAPLGEEDDAGEDVLELQPLEAPLDERDDAQEDIEIIQETQPPASGPKNPEDVVILSDDESIDHPRESNDDSDADGPPKVVELKPVIAPSGVTVKVEKGWWAMDEERRRKRKAREDKRIAEKEEQARKDREKDKRLAQAIATSQAAQKKLAEVEKDSKAKYSKLNSEVQQLMALVQATRSTQTTNSPAPPSHVMQESPPICSIPPPVVEEVQRRAIVSPHLRLKDPVSAIPLMHAELGSSMPVSPTPSAQHSDQLMFDDVDTLSHTHVEVSRERKLDQGYLRVYDTLGKGVRSPHVGVEQQVILRSRGNLDEEMVDYEASEEGAIDTTEVGVESTEVVMETEVQTAMVEFAQVHSTDPYSFE